jgi:glucan endo-1,3-alpha-glucosidase
MVNIVANHANSSSMVTFGGSVLVSTFAGSNYTDSFFSGFKSALASKGINITLAPAFIDYRFSNDADRLLSDFPSIDGFFNWFSWSVLSM